MNIEKLTASIVAHEGLRLYCYDDATGLPIVKGYTVRGQPTIGIGRLLTHMKGISDAEARILFSNDLQSCILQAEAQTWWDHVKDNDARSRAFCELIFNLGLKGLAGFSGALDAAMRDDWNASADGFLDSLWARQVGQRAVTIAEMIRSGMD